MPNLHKKLPKAKGATKTAIERRIKATDRKIDELVYAPYELGGHRGYNTIYML